MPGVGPFDEALRNAAELVRLGFDTRIICTVNRVNAGDSVRLLHVADELGVSLVKYHVFSDSVYSCPNSTPPRPTVEASMTTSTARTRAEPRTHTPPW